MRVAVVRLRRAGLRLRPHEVEPPVVGELIVADRATSSFMRVLRAAEVVELGPQGRIGRGLCGPLFDPVLVGVDPEGFSLVGIELDIDQGHVRELSQVWRCSIVGR